MPIIIFNKAIALNLGGSPLVIFLSFKIYNAFKSISLRLCTFKEGRGKERCNNILFNLRLKVIILTYRKDLFALGPWFLGRGAAAERGGWVGDSADPVAEVCRPDGSARTHVWSQGRTMGLGAEARYLPPGTAGLPTLSTRTQVAHGFQE